MNIVKPTDKNETPTPAPLPATAPEYPQVLDWPDLWIPDREEWPLLRRAIRCPQIVKRHVAWPS